MSEAVEDAVLAWVDAMVIGLGLCPFASGVRARLRVIVVDAADDETVATTVIAEARALLEMPPEERATTLVAAPALTDFDAYLDTVALLDALFEQMGLADDLQIASFHPAYCFADAPADDPANASNQAPLPLFHLLREADVSTAVATHPDIAQVPARNVALLRQLGWAEITAQRGW